MTYGCHGRQPMKTEMLVKDGYFQSKANGFDLQRSYSMKTIKIQTSTHCQYVHDYPNDQGCVGCRWRKDDVQET